MTKPIIEVHDLSKQYRLGVIGATTFRDSFDRWWQRLRRNGSDPDSAIRLAFQSQIKNLVCRSIANQKSKMAPPLPHSPSQDGYIWALKDVSFTVEQGEVLRNTKRFRNAERFTSSGRNGAGNHEIRNRKSEIQNAVGVGTGFQPELTGRENIASSPPTDFDAFCGEEDLNGAILGMKKAYIDGKFKEPSGFHETVAFAEIERFIDTPVKRSSSGMYVRLAFAVAAHLEPEILLVDEVLAVGDAAFQKKCLGKMRDVAREGRVV